MADTDVVLDRYPAGRALLKLLKERNLPDAQAIKVFIVKLLSEAAANGGADAAVAPRVNTDAAGIVIKGVSLLNPRGKFDLSFLEEQLVFSSPKQEFCLPFNAVRYVAILDDIPQDKSGKVLLFLALSKDAVIMNGKQRLDNIVLQSKADAALELARGGEELAGQPAAVALCMALGQHQVTSFINPDPNVFTSAKGAPALEAIVKVSQGWLYPLERGLCFIERPPQFIPLERIRCVELPRLAAGQSHTFDLLVHVVGADSKAGGVSEFKQISMAEAERLVAYLQAARVRIGSPDEQDDAAQHDQNTKHGGGAAGAVDDDEDEDSEDEEDEDFDPEASEEGEQPGRPAKRAKTEPGKALGAADAGAESEEIGDSDDEEEDEEDEYETDQEGEAAAGAAARSAQGKDELADEDEDADAEGAADEEEDEDEDEDEGEEEDDEEEGEEGDSDEDAELVDEEGISAANLQELIADDRKRKR